MSRLLSRRFEELRDLKVSFRLLSSSNRVLLSSPYLEKIRRKNKQRLNLVIEADNLGYQVFWYAHNVMYWALLEIFLSYNDFVLVKRHCMIDCSFNIGLAFAFVLV